MENFWQDVKYGARTLVKSPGFTVVAVVTLALGIGANSAIFSVINGVLLNSVPYEQPGALMFFTEWSEQVPNMSFSVANFKDVRDQQQKFESLVATWPEVREAYMLAGETDFLLKIVAPDWDSYQRFLSAKLTSAPNVSHVKSALMLRLSKSDPGVPIAEQASRAVDGA